MRKWDQTPLALWFRRVYTAMMDPHEERMYLRTLQKTERTNDLLVHALRLLDRNDAAVRRVEQTFTTLVQKITQLDHKMENLMSAISDFAAKVKAFTDRQDAAIDGLVADVKTLNDKITELQNSSGGISAEDQKLLDEIQNHASAVADKLDALDAQTPPPAPPPG